MAVLPCGKMEKRNSMHTPMQRLEGLMRKAMQQYNMVQPGDSICVGVSGGKDSVALTIALHNLSRYYEVPFTVKALTLDPVFNNVQTDFTPVQQLFASHGIPYQIERTNIGHIVFDIRQEANPCALCAKLRRGALHNFAKEMGCNKIALGHHLDDAVQTFYMNLFRGGRIGCFSPVTWLSRKQITMVRPLVLATEAEVIRAVGSLNLPVVKSTCPVDGDTERAAMKQFTAQRAALDPAFRQKTLNALQKAGIDGW